MTPYSNPKEFVYSCFELLTKEKENLLSLYRQGSIHYLSEALNSGIEKDFAEHTRGDKAAAYLYAGAVYNLEVYYLSSGATKDTSGTDGKLPSFPPLLRKVKGSFPKNRLIFLTRKAFYQKSGSFLRTGYFSF
jgi:hypothetical protein